MFTKIAITITLLVAFAGPLNGSSVVTNQDACPQMCPAVYAPVCATNGKVYKEFSNTCELSASNCRLERLALQTYMVTLIDWCITELIDNLDNLLEKLKNLDLTKPECLKPCTMIYQPVCISNGEYRTLASNDCLMDNINCALDYKNTFKVIQNNTC